MRIKENNAKIKVLNTGEEIPVLYNPKEYAVTTTIESSGEGTNTQFKLTRMPEFTVPLFFDTYEEGTDVRNLTEKITALQMPKVEGREAKTPPQCLFIWGTFSYQGIISKVEQKFTMFLGDGTPVRADLTVTFKELPSKTRENTRRGAEACRKLWQVKSGDRLDLIAYKTKKDPAEWRRIAALNNIQDPLNFPVPEDIGRMLVIPD